MADHDARVEAAARGLWVLDCQKHLGCTPDAKMPVHLADGYEIYLEQARAALAAADAVGVEGWKLVPTTLSRPMEDTLEECMGAWVDHEIEADTVWERTLSAAPPPQGGA